jgi:predicted metalloprotease with PDZ domain
MGRSSPGRYALHEFAKNVYNFKATDSQGKALEISRPNPYQWDINGHDGQVNISYTLFADRGDGTYGKKEVPYTLQDLRQTLVQYAGKEFGNHFFDHYIYKSEMPDYGPLFATVGVVLKQALDKPYFGANVTVNQFGAGIIQRNTTIGSPAYKAGLDSGDVITAINKVPLTAAQPFNNIIDQFKVGDTLKVAYTRYGIPKSTTVVLAGNPAYGIHLVEKDGTKPNKQLLKNRKDWLKLD